MIIFEQCDLNERRLFHEPKIKNKKDISYMSFEREDIEGTWCGINNYGVGFVSADCYVKDSKGTFLINDDNVYKAYENIISNYKTAGEAVEFIKKFYSASLSKGILIVSDKKESYYIESYNGEVIIVLLTPEFNPRYLVSTNHFRFIHEEVPFKENHSTYLRLTRAEDMLLKDCSLNGVKNLLKDQYYGRSVMSICRESDICPVGEEMYTTQATVIFLVNNNCNDIGVSYQINGNPEKNKMIFKDRIFH